ncbi:hypothetical protein D9M71_584020 [compost metagenome]
MGLLDFHLVTRMGLLPVFDELSVVLLVQLTGRVVGHVEQFVVLGDGGTGKNSTGQGGERITADGHGEAPDWHFSSFECVVRSAGLVAGLLQAELLLSLDLYDLSVVHSDLHRTEPQVAQGALDFPQNGGFVLTVDATQGCTHARSPWSEMPGRV